MLVLEFDIPPARQVVAEGEGYRITFNDVPIVDIDTNGVLPQELRREILAAVLNKTTHLGE